MNTASRVTAVRHVAVALLAFIALAPIGIAEAQKLADKGEPGKVEPATGGNLRYLEMKFDAAMDLVNRKQLAAAKSALAQLAQEMPPEWKAWQEDGNKLHRAYWSAEEFANCAPVEENAEHKEIVWAKPSWARIYYMLGYIEMEGRHLEESLHYLGTALKLDPSHPWIFYERGQVLMMMQRFEEALNHFRLAASIRPCAAGPVRATALANQGVVLIELDRLDEAESALQAALEVAPGYEKAKRELVYIQRLREGTPRWGLADITFFNLGDLSLGLPSGYTLVNPEQSPVIFLHPLRPAVSISILLPEGPVPASQREKMVELIVPGFIQKQADQTGGQVVLPLKRETRGDGSDLFVTGIDLSDDSKQRFLLICSSIAPDGRIANINIQGAGVLPDEYEMSRPILLSVRWVQADE